MQKILLIIVLFLYQVHVSYAQKRYEDEIVAFEMHDLVSMPQPHQILLVGSSSIRMWKTYKEDMEGYYVINRGFGGSTMSDVNEYFDRIVSKYLPKYIFVYEGDNDLASGKSPEEVLEDYKIFAEKVKKTLPKTKIAFCSIRPCLLRINILDKQRRFNQLLQTFCKQSKKYQYIDMQKDFYLPNGELMQDIFIEDKLHLNEKGYKIWTAAIRKHFAKNVK
ncbi:GDSL-type esterase/lipase family protein [Arcicella rigui]|uniref:GDSL-type esterase/lipase family protein n=1 Tax=Arcicella rigui TaxID=797020 RepID=A0ABU5QG14_9BACT|nr:GDSL-type esterase/lipase family protein [Arcicella rigui]MEA5141799.1 GDSL-type esterase/lipase family protein [Arcicella rigui]